MKVNNLELISSNVYGGALGDELKLLLIIIIYVCTKYKYSLMKELKIANFLMLSETK